MRTVATLFLLILIINKAFWAGVNECGSSGIRFPGMLVGLPMNDRFSGQ